jgi:hypothetical protein
VAAITAVACTPSELVKRNQVIGTNLELEVVLATVEDSSSMALVAHTPLEPQIFAEVLPS